jgi:hypothetical protein
MNTLSRAAAFCGMILMVVSSCANMQDSIIKKTTSGISSGVGNGVSRAASERAEQGAYKRLAPKSQLPAVKTPGWNQFMALHAQIIFSYSFSVGGFWLGTTPYQPGDWTKFEFKSKDDPTVTIEKAFLKKNDDGREWWRVTWSDDQETWVYEALIGSDGQLYRLRARDAKGNEGEVPVTEGSGMIYAPPTQLTKDSIQGASTGKEDVKTAAGTFNADHIVYMATGGEGQVEFWTTDKVPGGAVKYQITDKKEGAVWTCTLKEMGKDAKTILKSF